MSDDVGEIEVWDPPDGWVEGLIRAVKRLPPGTPVDPALVASWRRSLRTEAIRRARARRRTGRDPGPPPPPRPRNARRPQDITASEIVLEMLTSPHGQAAVAWLIGMPVLLAGLARFSAPRLCEPLRWTAEPLRRYLDAKLGGELAGDASAEAPWGARYDCPLAFRLAACNAVTTRRAADWRDRLESRSDAEARRVLSEMDELGRAAAVRAAPLRIWEPEPGPPRGFWPDPPPPPEEDSESVERRSRTVSRPRVGFP